MVTEAKPAQSTSNSLTVHFKDVPCAGWCPTWKQGGFAPGSYSAAGNGLAMGPTEELTGIIRCRSIWWSWIHCQLGWGSTTRMARSGKMPGPKFHTSHRQMDAIGSVIHAMPTVLSNIYLIFFGCLFDPVRIHIRRYSESFLNPSYFDNPPSPDTMDSSSKAVKLVAACYAHAGLKRIDPCLHW